MENLHEDTTKFQVSAPRGRRRAGDKPKSREEMEEWFMERVQKLATYGDREVPVPPGKTGCWKFLKGNQPDKPLQREALAERYSMMSPPRTWRWAGPKSTGAHRVAYKLWRDRSFDLTRGKELQVDHRCRRKGCVNPEHLRITSARRNVLLQPTNILGELETLKQYLADHDCPGTLPHVDEIIKIVERSLNLP